MTAPAHTHTFTSDSVTLTAPMMRLFRSVARTQTRNLHALAARCVR